VPASFADRGAAPAGDGDDHVEGAVVLTDLGGGHARAQN